MTISKAKQHRVPANHPKRQGQHHRHSRDYIKAYWPYLPVFAILGVGLLVNGWVGRMHHDVLGYATNISSQVLLARTNSERLSRHASALTLNTELTAAAQAKADDMAKRGYWSHITPDGKQPWTFVEASGYRYQAAGENLAYGFGTSDQVMTAWMQSPSHRDNVLNPNYQDVGFATANVADYRGTGPQTIIVAMYGEPTDAISVAPNQGPIVLGTETSTVSRLGLISTVQWLPMAVAALCGAALMLFFARHAFAWHKVLVRGEHFILSHPLLDVGLMGAAVLSLLLYHTAGTIL